MTQAVIIDKGVIERGFRGQHSRLPAHMIGPMEAQTARNCHVNNGTLEKDRGFTKLFNDSDGPPGLFFRNHNTNPLLAASVGVGVVSYVRIPHHADYNVTTSWTLSWLMEIPETPSAETVIMGKGGKVAANRTFEVYVTTGRLIRIEFDTPAGAVSLATLTAVALNTGTRITFRRSTTTLDVFINGVLDNTATITATANDSNAQPIILGGRLRDSQTDGNIGPEGGHVQNAYKGMLDDLRFYNAAVQNGVVAEDFDRELGSTDAANSALVGYWKMNEGTGITIACESYVTGFAAKAGTLKWYGPTFVSGLIDESTTGAWDFDGYAKVGIIAQLSPEYNVFAWSTAPPGQFTVELNIQPRDVSRAQTLAFMGDETSSSPTSVCFAIRINSSGFVRFEYYDGTTLRSLTTTLAALVIGKHYHIAAIRNTTGAGYTARLIVWNITDDPDSRAVNSATYQVVSHTQGTNAPNQAARTTIGMLGTSRSPYTGTNTPDPYDGVIDEIRFWSTDRSAYNGQDLVQRHGNGQVFFDESGLIGYWPLDDERPEFALGEAVASANASRNSNSILGFPNTYPPVWANGLVTRWTLDQDGVTVNGKSLKVTFLQTFAAAGEDEKLFLAQGCNLYRVNAAGNKTLLYRGLDRDLFLDGVVFADVLYLCNGTNYNLAYIGDEVFFMGIPRPGPIVAATADPTPTTGFRNKRRYVYTHYDSRTGYEGSISQPSRIVDNGTTINGAALLVFPSANPRVTHIRIYATLSSAGDPGSTYFRLAEIPNIARVEKGFNVFLAPVIDDITDQILQTRTTIDLLRDPPRAMKYMTVYQDRIYGVSDDLPNRLYFSQLPNLLTGAHAEAFSETGFTTFEENNGDVITALAVVRAKLVVGKNTSVWEQPVGGTQGLPLKPIARHRDHGIASHFSCANIDTNLLAYLSTRGFYVYDGVEHTLISLEIENVVQLLDESELVNTFGAHFRKRQEVIWSTVVDGVRMVLSFDYRGGGWIRRTAWDTSVLRDIRAVKGRDERFLIGTQHGYVLLYDDVADGEENQGAGSSSDLSGQASSGTTTTINSPLGTWPTAEDGLRGVIVTVEDIDTGVIEDFLIISNTASQLRLGGTRGSNVVNGDFYRIGQIDFAWKSRDEFVQNTVNRPRWMFIEIHGDSDNIGDLTVSFTKEKEVLPYATKDLVVTGVRRHPRIQINQRATFLAIGFSDPEPNAPKKIESYALSVVPTGRDSNVIDTGVTS